MSAAKEATKSNVIAKKSKKSKKTTKESTVDEETVDAVDVKRVPTGKHIVFDDDDEPVAVAAKKSTKKGHKENVKDIGKRWYEEVSVTAQLASQIRCLI